MTFNIEEVAQCVEAFELLQALLCFGDEKSSIVDPPRIKTCFLFQTDEEFSGRFRQPDVRIAGSQSPAQGAGMPSGAARYFRPFEKNGLNPPFGQMVEETATGDAAT
jgi:hypothetical protein